MKFLCIPIVLGALCCAPGLRAQTLEAYKRQAKAEMDAYRQQREREYKEYRDRINAEFADYMRRAWSDRDAQPAQPVPDRPEPPRPAVKRPDAPPSADSLPFGRVVPKSRPAPSPQPAVPLPVPDGDATESFAFTYYGTPCSVPLGPEHHFSLRGADERSVADAWGILSSDAYLPVVAACLSLRERLRLCDWGYVRLVERMASAFFPPDERNEARLLQMYVLTQSGYKVRIARAENSLVLLLPSEANIYGYPYLSLGDCRYYITDPSMRQKRFAVFDREFPAERLFSLRIPVQPLLAADPATSRTLSSRRFPDVSACVTVSRNLVAFFDDYPRSDAWEVYAGAALSDAVREQLYPVLRRAIAGKEKFDAANVLLDFVQTAFAYKTDEEQFGSERPLFADETLFYPFSDCEDRAILFTVLVRDLLSLDVVLLHYPGHLATAVRFGDGVGGDYVSLDEGRYTVCDPTYIGASAGEAMPECKRVDATVIRID